MQLVPGVIVERGVQVPMRDGITLSTDVYRPDGDGPYPVLYMRNPYGRTLGHMTVYHHPTWYARNGYIVLIQDVRGRWDSEGAWDPFEHDGTDGYDTIAWAANLPYSNGKVGTYGFSYGAGVQFLTASLQPRALVCMAAACFPADLYDGFLTRGGAVQLAFLQSWAFYVAQDRARRAGDSAAEAQLLQLANAPGAAYQHLPLAEHELLDKYAPFYRRWLNTPPGDPEWQQWSVRKLWKTITVPTLHIGGWYDTFADGTLENFLGMRQHAATDHARQNQRLVFGPWWHMPWGPRVGALDFGPEAVNRVNEWQLQWFDHWLKPGPVQLPGAVVRYFVMGANEWRSRSDWPQTTDWKKLFLRSNGLANGWDGDGSLAEQPASGTETPDVFVHNPRNPVPSLGGRSCCFPGAAPMGPADQRPVLSRRDVLVYIGEPLAEYVVVTGKGLVELWVASDGESTDFVIAVMDVGPDGRAINVTDGVSRISVDSTENASLANRDLSSAFQIKVPLAVTSHRFAAGHRIALSIAGSSFPAFDRNSGKNLSPAKVTLADLQMTTQSVFHDYLRPSCLLLPYEPSSPGAAARAE